MISHFFRQYRQNHIVSTLGPITFFVNELGAVQVNSLRDFQSKNMLENVQLITNKPFYPPARHYYKRPHLPVLRYKEHKFQNKKSAITESDWNILQTLVVNSLRRGNISAAISYASEDFENLGGVEALNDDLKNSMQSDNLSELKFARLLRASNFYALKSLQLTEADKTLDNICAISDITTNSLLLAQLSYKYSIAVSDNSFLPTIKNGIINNFIRTSLEIKEFDRELQQNLLAEFNNDELAFNQQLIKAGAFFRPHRQSSAQKSLHFFLGKRGYLPVSSFDDFEKIYENAVPLYSAAMFDRDPEVAMQEHQEMCDPRFPYPGPGVYETVPIVTMHSLMKGDISRAIDFCKLDLGLHGGSTMLDFHRESWNKQITASDWTSTGILKASNYYALKLLELDMNEKPFESCVQLSKIVTEYRKLVHLARLYASTEEEYIAGIKMVGDNIDSIINNFVYAAEKFQVYQQQLVRELKGSISTNWNPPFEEKNHLDQYFTLP